MTSLMCCDENMSSLASDPIAIPATPAVWMRLAARHTHVTIGSKTRSDSSAIFPSDVTHRLSQTEKAVNFERVGVVADIWATISS